MAQGVNENQKVEDIDRLRGLGPHRYRICPAFMRTIRLGPELYTTNPKICGVVAGFPPLPPLPFPCCDSAPFFLLVISRSGRPGHAHPGASFSSNWRGRAASSRFSWRTGTAALIDYRPFHGASPHNSSLDIQPVFPHNHHVLRALIGLYGALVSGRSAVGPLKPVCGVSKNRRVCL